MISTYTMEHNGTNSLVVKFNKTLLFVFISLIVESGENFRHKNTPHFYGCIARCFAL